MNEVGQALGKLESILRELGLVAVAVSATMGKACFARRFAMKSRIRI